MSERKGKNEMICCADGSPVSRIALGTMYFGTRITRENAGALLSAYTECGGNQIDTARSYASWIDGKNGTSERAIGGWLRNCKNRGHLFIGTKGGLMPRGYNCDRGNLSKAHLTEELQESLTALGTDYADVFWLHRDERDRPVEEIVDTCDQLICRGLTRYIGASNWSTKRIEEANIYAKKAGKHGFSMSQIQFGLGVCTPKAWGDDSVVCMDRASYDWYCRADLPLYAYSAQAQGFFGLLIKGGEQALSDDTKQKYMSKKNRVRAERLAAVSRETGISVSALVMQYVLSREFQTYFILGTGRAERVREAFDELQVKVPERIWEQILREDEANTDDVSAFSRK